MSYPTEWIVSHLIAVLNARERFRDAVEPQDRRTEHERLSVLLHSLPIETIAERLLMGKEGSA